MAELFGTLPDGREVYRVFLRCGEMCCELLTYGAALRTLTVPDREGKHIDVVLGYDRAEDYASRDNPYFGAVVGRFANRIGGSAFDLGGVHYALPANEGENHLHGGPDGFGWRLWTVESESENAARLSLTSPDGDAGYPGTLKAEVTYTLTSDALRLDYQAVSDKDTLCNLTNHAYFNLAGHDSGGIEKQTIRLFADAYTPTDAGSIPTGKIADVAGTPMDLREAVPIGAHIDEDFEQLRFAGGYDHNFVLRGEAGTLRPAAEAYCAESGVCLTVETTLPGIQFYAGNYLGKSPAGKGGARYARRQGFCLETQVFPDAPHHDNFPTAVLRAGDTYRSTTVFRFHTK